MIGPSAEFLEARSKELTAALDVFAMRGFLVNGGAFVRFAGIGGAKFFDRFVVLAATGAGGANSFVRGCNGAFDLVAVTAFRRTGGGGGGATDFLEAVKQSMYQGVIFTKVIINPEADDIVHKLTCWCWVMRSICGHLCGSELV